MRLGGVGFLVVLGFPAPPFMTRCFVVFLLWRGTYCWCARVLKGLYCEVRDSGQGLVWEPYFYWV